MTDGILTCEQIITAAQDVLRRYGPAKATVVDVARALGVSHGSVYRHFPSKTALREAVTHRWLEEAHAGLAAVMASSAPADVRLREWLTTLSASKRAKALDDPELFATYMVLVNEASEVIQGHITGLVDQLEEIIATGAARGELATADPAASARTVFLATNAFHDPAHAASWSRPEVEEELNALCDLLLLGLKPR
ncbi:TetR family transcriptional regulator [Nonomuraea maheshkhaliensis]|uniref:TetR family transcriptional regulator n=1 Tax=Nonomuraea maheshkhaliensis TaxID=419590 RepID=A0ABN2F5V1_9ACTN